MITNEFQKKKTLGFVKRLRSGLEKLNRSQADEKIKSISASSLQKQINDLVDQVAEYDKLKELGVVEAH